MLKSPTLRQPTNLDHITDPVMRQEVREYSDISRWLTVEHCAGVMLVDGFNSQYSFEEPVDSYDTGHSAETVEYMRQIRPEQTYDLSWGDFPNYGVVDSPAQFCEMFAAAIDTAPGNFYVTLTEVRRKDEPKSGGWRYHKWGEYYGTQEPQCEYLYDDLHIDSVWCFHVHRYK